MSYRFTHCTYANNRYEESACNGCEEECDSVAKYYVEERIVRNNDDIYEIIKSHRKYSSHRKMFLNKDEADEELKKLKKE